MKKILFIIALTVSFSFYPQQNILTAYTSADYVQQKYGFLYYHLAENQKEINSAPLLVFGETDGLNELGYYNLSALECAEFTENGLSLSKLYDIKDSSNISRMTLKEFFDLSDDWGTNEHIIIKWTNDFEDVIADLDKQGENHLIRTFPSDADLDNISKPMEIERSKELKLIIDKFNNKKIERSKKQIKDSLIIKSLSKVSISRKKYNLSISYDECNVSSFVVRDIRGRKKNHYISSYNSKENIHKITYLNLDEFELFDYNELSVKYYKDDILIKKYEAKNDTYTNYRKGIKQTSEIIDSSKPLAILRLSKTYYSNGNLESSGNHLRGASNHWTYFINPKFRKINRVHTNYTPLSTAVGTWKFYSKNGNYTANADLDDKYKGEIKDSAEIYKSGVFLKKVRLKNKRKGKLLDLLNELDSDN
jgi:hypothetical protein